MRDSEIAISNAIEDFAKGVTKEMGVGLKSYSLTVDELVRENEDYEDSDIHIKYEIRIELTEMIPNKYYPDYYPETEEEEKGWYEDFAKDYWKNELKALEKTLDKCEREERIWVGYNDATFYMSEKYGYTISIPMTLIIQPLREFKSK